MDSSLSPVPLDITSSSATRLRSIPTYKNSKEKLKFLAKSIPTVPNKDEAIESTRVQSWLHELTSKLSTIVRFEHTWQQKKLFHIDLRMQGNWNGLWIQVRVRSLLQYALDWQTWGGRGPCFKPPLSISTPFLKATWSGKKSNRDLEIKLETFSTR